MSEKPLLTKQECAELLTGIKPETMDKLEIYLELLNKWQKAINLVGKNTLSDAWRRHILDSAQIVSEIEKNEKIVDLGSGAGFPGLVVAIVTGASVELVESDQRKATFMREVARETGTGIKVHVERIEDLDRIDADIITARALAPLSKLIPWVHRHLIKGGKSLLLKGADVDQELTECRKQWTMNVIRKPSMTDANGTILIVDEISPLTDG